MKGILGVVEVKVDLCCFLFIISVFRIFGVEYLDFILVVIFRFFL